MTSFDIATIVPLKYKPLVGLVGSVLTFVIPTVLEASTQMAQPWPWIIAAVVALLTALGIYRAPYKPAGTVLVTKTPGAGNINVNVTPDVSMDAAQTAAREAQQYRNPWR